MSPQDARTGPLAHEVPDPDLIRVQAGPVDGWGAPELTGVAVRTSRDGLGLRIEVAAGAAGVARVHLRWRLPVPEDVLILGDAWERSYGDLGWRSHRPERPLPWLCLVHERASGITWGAGVDVRGGAMACWTVDPSGLSLWLDLRAGDGPVMPGDRPIHAATIRMVRGSERPFAVQAALTAALCVDPLLPPTPLAGANNWYYAYGKGFDAGAVVRDARTIAELVGDHPVRPFGVVDDGWSAHSIAAGRQMTAGPWDLHRAPAFGPMPELAAAVRAEGVRPGIWFRPLLTTDERHPGILTPRDGAFSLDLTHPATLETAAADIGRLAGWGFELIKHDFSTYDFLGRWGSAMGASVTGRGRNGASAPYAGPSWTPADTTHTNAESIVRFHRVLREAAGDALLLACDVIGHLAAGLAHAQRSGDDTSGKEWERTRRVGVNTLAFRLTQHGRFFAVDADCVPSTPATPWALNRRFLDLVARSGTALFVSVDPATRSDAVDRDLAAALRLALDGGDPGGIEPLDWLTSTTPGRWRTAAGEQAYDWMDDAGADPYEWGEHNR